MHSTSIKKIIAGVAAVATAAMGLALAAPAANAADGDDTTPTSDNTPSSDWNSNQKTGTINIYKREANGKNHSTNGTGHWDNSAATSGNAVANVKFTATLVVNGPTLSDADSPDWSKLGNLSYKNGGIYEGNSTTPTGWALSTNSKDIHSGSTDKYGNLSFADIPLGLYYITEDASNNHDVDQAASDPFFVVLPFPDSTQSGKWLYTVDVYPKMI